MSFDEYWQTLMELKPIKDGQTVTLTKEQFKRMMQRAYKKGESQKSVFESLFGKL